MAQVEKIVKTYRKLAQIPALAGACISANGTIVKSVWSQRNLEKGKTTKFQCSHILSQNFVKLGEVPPVDVSSELLRCTSKSEQLQCVIRESDSKQYFEIWTRNNLSKCIDLKALDLHGDIYTDGEFGTLEFSRDETQVVFIAEKKQPKTEPFIKRKQENPDSKDEGDVIKQGQEYVYLQDWGEQLVNKKQSVVVVYTIENDSFEILEGIPEDVCPAKVVWSTDGSYVVGIAYKTEPRKLGLIYCTNRLSTIFLLTTAGVYTELPLTNKSVKDPRITPDGSSVIWLQRDAGGAHAGCMALMKTDLPFSSTSKADPIVDIVQNQIDINNNKIFHGLYNQSFSKRCFTNDGRLLVSTNQKNTINSYVIDLKSSLITKLECDTGSQIILDVHNDVVLACNRNFLKQDILMIAKIPENNEFNIVWDEVTTSETIEGLENYTYEYLDIEQNNDDSIRRSSAIYFGPESGPESGFPLVVWPHGGPHSAFANNLSLEASLFASLGYAVLLVNYRGSIGAGEASVNFLLGRVGSADVEDCVLATKTALGKYPWLNGNQVALVGGSHGGFLVTHLSGQYPDMYKAVVARNPVIDVASMSICSDIPDWCFVEAGAEYTQVGKPSDDLLLKMRQCSPIMHAHKIKAPTLLQIGSKDLRVPPSQSVDFYLRLKANNVPVKMNMYDDNHPLGNVPNEVDNLINTVLWLQQYLKI